MPGLQYRLFMVQGPNGLPVSVLVQPSNPKVFTGHVALLLANGSIWKSTSFGQRGLCFSPKNLRTLRKNSCSDMHDWYLPAEAVFLNDS